MVSVSSTSILGLVIAFLILGFLIWNIVYLGGVLNTFKNPRANLNLSRIGAEIITAVNAIAIIFVALYIVYLFWLILTTSSQRVVIAETLTTTRAGTGLPFGSSRTSRPPPQ